MGKGNGAKRAISTTPAGNALSEALASGQPFSVRALAEAVPEIADLASCAQDPVWHAEGDVLTHTERALEVLWTRVSADDPRWPRLTAATLLHDIGKPRAQGVNERGRITAYGHEDIGVPIARELLRAAGWNGGARDAVLHLVRQHMRPRQLTAGDAHDIAFRRLALEVDVEELLLLLEADRLGRDADGVGTDWARVKALFHARLEELGLRGHPFFAFSDEELDGIGTAPEDRAAARGRVAYAVWAGDVRDREAARSLLYDLRADRARGALYLTAGAPGSGKSTWARSTGLPRVSTDEVRRAHGLEHASTRKRAELSALVGAALKEKVRAGGDLVFDATSVGPHRRAKVLDLARRYGYRVIGVSFDLPPARVLAQNRARPDPVPEEAVRGYLTELVPFAAYEADTVIRPWES